MNRGIISSAILGTIFLACVLTMFVTLNSDSGLSYETQHLSLSRAQPVATVAGAFGYDALGRSILGRCLLGGAISLAIGLASATISVFMGVMVGMLAGYLGGWVDAVLMRMVDILYGLPYILLVILFKIALEPWIEGVFRHYSPGHAAQNANLVVLFLSIGLVSWLTMARIVRGQVMAIRALPYIEACRAIGIGKMRIFLRHVLPNLVGPITVYATLTIPGAILQESFLSFLGIGVKLPLPTWGNLASEGVNELSPIHFYWWMLVFPCALLMVTLLCLNFLGDGLRDVLDPKRDAAKL